MDEELVWKTVEAERRALADLLEALPDNAWDEASLCTGWRVRDVAAHVTLTTRARPLSTLVGVLKAGGNPNRWVAQEARARAARPPSELVAELRQAAASRHHPPGTKPLDPLVDVLVHTQDIAIPLGLRAEMPLAAAEAAADRLWSMSVPFFARRRCAGVRLEADDTDWSKGAGDEATGPIKSIVLVLAGRRAGPDDLRGPGAARLAATFA